MLEIKVIYEPNRIAFKNGSQDRGDITYSNLVCIDEETNEYKVDFEGTNVQGGSISETGVLITLDTGVNPTKVFWAVVAVLKEVLCPECI